MRRWLPRALWLLAWYLWAWLGWGLYRELPRNYGPPLCRLPVHVGSTLLGFVGETNTFAVDTAHLHVHLFDAETGRNVGVRPMPRPGRLFARWNSEIATVAKNSIKQGVLFGMSEQRANAGDSPAWSDDFGVLHVVTGEWRRLFDRPVRFVATHPSRPLAAVVETPEEGPSTAVIFDLLTGAKRFRRELALEEKFTAAPFFLPRGDRLALPVCRYPHRWGGQGQFVLELWPLERSETSPEIVPVHVNWPAAASFSADGSRVLFEGQPAQIEGEDAWVDVYDVQSSRFLPSIPLSEQRRVGKVTHAQGYLGGPSLAPSGRAALRYGVEAVQEPGSSRTQPRITSGTLYEIDTGRTLWQAGASETVTTADAEGFFVEERWQVFWERWLTGLKYETVARRRLDDAALDYRVAIGKAADPQTCNRSRTLHVASDGFVFRLPLRVNYPLLALCQAILALPLVLLWAALRWRRKQRMRLAGVAP